MSYGFLEILMRADVGVAEIVPKSTFFTIETVSKGEYSANKFDQIQGPLFQPRFLLKVSHNHQITTPPPPTTLDLL